MQMTGGKWRKFRLAASVAERPNLSICHAKQHHGAALFRGGAAISVGYNKNRYNALAHSLRLLPGIGTKHAEIDCLLGIDPKIVLGCDLYVVRINRRRSIMLSRPCQMCIDFMAMVGVRRCFYTLDDNSFEVLEPGSAKSTFFFA